MKIDRRRAGKIAECPKCKKKFKVPIPKKTPKSVPQDEDEDDFLSALSEATASERRASSFSTCPECAEDVSPRARECEYCGANLAAYRANSKKKKKKETYDDGDCINCGAALAEDARFCVRCGHSSFDATDTLAKSFKDDYTTKDAVVENLGLFLRFMFFFRRLF